MRRVFPFKGAVKMSKHLSRMITAMKEWNTVPSGKIEAPKGVFGRKILIKSENSSGKIVIDSETLDCEFNVPFDDNTEANEAEIVVYNLTQNTIKNLKNNQVITITAGYGNDTGVIFNGRISKTTTKSVGVDKQTTIYAIDDADRKEKDIVDLTFAAGRNAAYILRNLVNRIGLPVAVFKVRFDYTYENEVKVTGGLMSNIEKYAKVCGVSAYILKGKVYVRHISNGSDIKFTVSEETGLIGSPEEFEEENERTAGEETITETIKGYKLKMLLQHRMTTGAVITLKSVNANGRYVVREGVHSFDGKNFTTEVTVVP